MRSVRSELSGLLTVLAIPLGIAAVFPYSALRFEPAAVTAPERPFAAFTELTPEAEREALKAAKTSGRAAAGGMRNLRADLFLAELPDDRPEPVAAVGARTRPAAPPAVPYGTPAYRPSLAAPPPAVIAPVKAPEAPVFSKAEMLKME